MLRAPGFSVTTRVVVLVAFYLVGGLLGNEAAFNSSNSPLVWPSAGIALGAILLFGSRYWPGVAMGAVLFSIVNGMHPLMVTLGTVLGSTIGALVCAYLLERFVKFDPRMERVRDVAGLVGFACLLGTTVNAAFNTVSRSFAGTVPWETLFSSMVEWWVPNAMAGLVVAPLILAWGTPSSIRWDSKLIVEAACCCVGLVGGTLVSFNSWYVYGIQSYPLAYLPYPFMVWASLRFGQRGATTSSVLVSALAIKALLEKRGPFVAPSEVDSLMLIGSYIGVVSVTNLLLAAAASERRLAERSLVASECRYRGVVEDQTELISRFKPDGTLTFVNQSYARFHQRRSEDLIGSNSLEALPEEDRQIPLSYFATLTPESPVIQYDHKVALSTGRVIWQQCTVRALFDEQGKTVEYQTVAADITRLKRTEEAIRDGEQRLRSILDGMVDGVLVVNADGMVSSCNPAAEALLGRRASRVIGRPIPELFGGTHFAAFNEYIQNRLTREDSRIVETLVERPDGATAPIDMAITEVPQEDGALQVIVMRDISERKRLEDQFRQAQKMDAVGRLAGGIAHDFNNLMQAIIGFTSLLLRRIKAEDPNRDTIQQIEQSAERAASLTRQLLAFSRKQVLQPKLLSLNAVVDDMHKLLLRLIGENIRLEKKITEPAGYVRADPGQISQVIMNLAINARDAMPQGGTLSIGTATVEIGVRPEGFLDDFRPGSYVVLHMIDTGCGMSDEVKAHLFEPFFTTKEVGKGTGLGLSIVYGALRQMGAQITVRSEPMQGTEFRIYFQRENAPEEVQEQQPAPVLQGTTGQTLLLVEDEEVVRLLLVEVLKEEGFHVLDAGHGEEALRVAESHPGQIDLLVTDLTMPHMGGRELASKLLAQRSNLKVLFVSGYMETSLVSPGEAGCVTDFLQKPFRPDSLLEKVRAMLAQH